MRRRSSIKRLGAVIAAPAVFFMAGCDGDHSSDAPVVIDERTGAYGDLRLRSSEAELKRLLGDGERGEPSKGPLPLGTDPGEVSGPRSLPGGLTYLRYPDLAVLVGGGKVRGYVTTSEDAQTSAGLAVGDELSLAKGR